LSERILLSSVMEPNLNMPRLDAEIRGEERLLPIVWQWLGLIVFFKTPFHVRRELLWLRNVSSKCSASKSLLLVHDHLPRQTSAKS
jgi:hypothetical protein